MNTQKVCSLQDMIDISKRAGQHWFDTDTMKFFNSKIQTPIYKGGPLDGLCVLFVSSERGPDNQRKYSVRVFEVRTGDILGGKELEKITGDFQEFKTSAAAHNRIKKVLQDGEAITAIRAIIQEHYKREAEHLRAVAERSIEEARLYDALDVEAAAIV